LIPRAPLLSPPKRGSHTFSFSPPNHLSFLYPAARHPLPCLTHVPSVDAPTAAGDAGLLGAAAMAARSPPSSSEQ
jgi:hypothetical protein